MREKFLPASKNVSLSGSSPGANFSKRRKQMWYKTIPARSGKCVSCGTECYSLDHNGMCTNEDCVLLSIDIDEEHYYKESEKE
jgi:hypothetical protein